MDAGNIPSRGKTLRRRPTSRYGGNLHVINTSIPNPVIDAPVIARTVTAIPKAFASAFKEQKEVKNLAIQRSPKSFLPKGAAISFTKKKINAAKNFLKQHNKETFVPTLKKKDSPNLPSKQGKEVSSCTVIMPEKVSSYLALQAASMQGVKNKSTVVVKTLEKKKVDIPVQKENSVSSWVPVDTKLKSNQFKDSPFPEKKDVSSKNDSSSLSKVSVGNKKKPDPFEDFLVDKKEKIPARKESQSSTRMSSYFRKERSLHKYSSSARHFSSREEEERYYEKRYRSSRSSRSRRSRDYERESARRYKESNPYRWERKIQEPKKSAREEVLDDVSDVPLEEDFEEVETASVEDSTKPSEIPVGFRKYRIRHLKTFKSVGFFKPKRYVVCRERTVVNCLNLEEDESVEIDIASEVECEADHEAKIDSAAAKDKAHSVQHESTENEKQVDDVKVSENNRNGLEKGLVSNPGDEKPKPNFKKHDVVKDASSENLDKVEKLEESCAVKTDNMLQSEKLENSHMMDVDALDSAFEIKIKEPQQVVKNSKVYYTCIPDLDSPDFYQGCSLNQKHLDEWQSHLIGLEYVVEIRNKFNKSQVEKYYCGLCQEDFPDLSATESRVTNHISSYVHGFLYMAKHFPSCGYKFSKNGSYACDFVLQKCCEEINNKLGHYFMCVTTNDYFQKHVKEIKELFNSLPHWSEVNMVVDPTVYVSDLDSNIEREISDAVSDLIGEIVPGEGIATCITSRNDSVQDLRKKKVNSGKDISNGINTTSFDSVSTRHNLIVLTTQHRRVPKTTVQSTPTRPNLSNLLQVVTHESPPPNLKQVTLASGVPIQESHSVLGGSNKVTDQQDETSNQSAKVIPEKVTPSENAMHKSVSDGSSFKSVTKKANSFRRYRPQQNTFSKSKLDQNKEVRIVRRITKGSSDATISLDFKDSGSSQIDPDCSAPGDEENVSEQEMEEVEDYLSDENTEQVHGPQDENTLESEFSDSAVVCLDISPGDPDAGKDENSKCKGKTKHRPHQKTTLHSKHCIKRILSRSSKSTKDPDDLDDVAQTDSKLDVKHGSDIMRLIKDLSPEGSKSSGSSRKITSPLKTRYSPRRHSRSPGRRRSRSPYKRRSRSPFRRRDSPFRRHSRSPIRRHSRSPVRRYSRSPVRRRISPKRRSRTPPRRRSRSPIRRRSRSPFRRHSRSPVRRRSRSPIRRRSKSPVRRPSPSWRSSRVLSRRKSRSPYRRISRSPVGSHSSSRKTSISPQRRIPVGGPRVPFEKSLRSPLRKEPKRYESEQAPFRSDSRSSFYKDSDATSSSYKHSESSKHTPHPRHLNPEPERELSDLDPISDEGESAYFNVEGPHHLEEIRKLPEPTRSMVVQLLQKFSISKVNPNDPSFNDLMQFVNSHGSQIQQLMAQPSSFSDVNVFKQGGNSSLSSRGAALQEYLMSNLTGPQNVLPNQAYPPASPAFGSPFPSTSSGIPFPPPRHELPTGPVPQPMFQPPNANQQFAQHAMHQPPQHSMHQSPQHAMHQPLQHTMHQPPPHTMHQPPQHTMHQPPPHTMHQPPPHTMHQPPQHTVHQPPPQGQPQTFGNIPPVHASVPQQPYNAFSQQNEPPNFRPKGPTEVMFKDLKATVSKLFGANEGGINVSAPPPSSREFVTEQLSQNWGLNRQNPPNPVRHFDSLSHKNIIVDDRDDSDFRNLPRGTNESQSSSSVYPNKSNSRTYFGNEEGIDKSSTPNLHIPPPDAKVAFCDASRAPVQRNLFPVVSSPQRMPDYGPGNSQNRVDNVKLSVAQRLAAVLVKVGMVDVPAALLQEMLMKIGAFSSCPPQDISEREIIDILKKLRYL